MNNYLNIVNSKPLQNGSMNIGEFPSETASIAYDGTLLPTGTASYGSELVVNGDFSNGLTSWVILNTDATHTVTAEAGGVRFIADTTTVLTTIKQNIGTTNIAKTYLLTITISDYVSGSLKFDINGSTTVLPTAIGTYTYFYNPTVDGNLAFYRNSSNVNIRLDNVSVKEVLINPNLRYLKNSGKDKTPALVESGQGKFFNGTNQYIDTGIVPNQAQGTLVTRFTYATGMTTKVAVGGLNSGQRFYVGVNSTGKIGVAIGTNAFDTAGQFITDTLVNGQSYHVALKYVGINIEVFVDSVKRLTFSVSGFNPSLGTFFVGSSHTNLTPTLYFNNVIDETYYYDVALTDAQIGLLYSYPEKVKAYNGAIVPDIGSEANCKLFLPLCENSGSNVVNVAVARSGSITISSETPTLATYVGGVLTPTASTSGRLDIRPAMTNIVVGDFIEFSVNMISVNVNTRITLATNAGGWASVTSIVATVGTNTIFGQIPSGSTVVYCLIYPDIVNGTAPCTVGTYTVKEITAYPLTNYTTAMHTSAAKLSYGAQCTAWKRDSLGVLLGMSGGLSFDGGVSVKGVSTGWTPNVGSSFVIECIQYIDSVATGKINGVSATGRVSLGQATANSVRFILNPHDSSYAGVATGYRHIVMKYDFDLKRAWSWIDGVVKWDNRDVTTFTASPTSPFSFGAETVIASSLTSIEGTPKIYKGTQYAKFDIAKAWSRAQKTIAKLGA